MVDITLIFNIALSLASLTLMITEFLVIILAKDIYRSAKDYFLLIFSILVLYAASNFAGLLTENFMDNPIYTQIFIFIESAAASVLMLLVSAYMLTSCGKDASKSPLMIIIGILWVIYMVILVYTQFSTTIYYISADNAYHRGPYYPILLVPLFLILLIDLVTAVVLRKQLSKVRYLSFLAVIAAPVIALVVQLLFYGLILTVFTTALAATMLFLSAVSDQISIYKKEREDSVRKSANIAVLQMRPHFIYNVLTSIYYLIGQDPEKAQQVIFDFTNYLRRNMTAMTQEKTIPFTEELEHIKAYLAVEQVRFENQLFVEYDTPHILFRLPPLTLQPLVENCVKHGIDPEAKPLHVLVKTKKVEGGSEITVTDDGPGFSTENKGTPRVALASIKQRLLLICSGSLQIESEPGKGTTVTLFIPAEKAPREGGGGE